MKPLEGLVRTLGFGLLAALAVIPWQLVLTVVVTPTRALSAYALLCACGFAVVVAPNLRAAFIAAVACAPLAIAAFVLAEGTGAALLAAALIAAFGRGLSYRADAARTIASELVLLVLSLAAARLFGDGSPFGAALGLWSYFLVQSAFFLVLRPEPRAATAAGDPFEDAHARAVACSNAGDVRSFSQRPDPPGSLGRTYRHHLHGTAVAGLRPWLVIRAIESTEYVVVTDSDDLIVRLRATFRDVRDSPGDLEPDEAAA